MERIRGRNAQAAWQRYILPVGIAVVALLLIISFFSRGSTAGSPKTGSFVEASPAAQDSVVRIVYNGSSNDAVIDKTEKVYLGEKVVADKGAAVVGVPDSLSSFRLKERGKLKFLGSEAGNYSFQLENSELWVKGQSGKDSFKLTHVDVVPEAGSVVNLFQNQVYSTVYVIAGSATVTGKGGGGVVTAGNKVVVTGATAGDPSAKQEPLDDSFRSGEWFASNGGMAALAQGSASAAATGAALPAFSAEASVGPAAVTFDNVTDELTVEKSPLAVSGTAPRASKVSVGGLTAVVDPATRKFTVPAVALAEGANDLVWKALDAEGATMAKGVITVYLPKKKASALPNKVVSYPLNDKDYKIVSPAGNPFTTSEDFVKISGVVPAGVVDRITVNDYQLKTSFRAGGTTWYYFANKEFGTLGDGLNPYKIRYYAADGKLLLESLFTIVREPAKAAVSGEAKAN